MSDNPFTRPTGAAAVTEATDPTATKHSGYPLPPSQRGYNPDGDRDRFGRYQLPDPEGKATKRLAFTRATTGAKTLEDTYNLHAWDVRQVVTGLHTQPELLEQFPEFGDYSEQRNALERIADQARIEAGSADSSEFGTALHAWLEAVDQYHCEVSDVPAIFRPKVEKYMEMRAEWGIGVPEKMVERIVWHRASGFVGTFDRIYTLADDTRVIGDVKTSKDLKYSYMSISAQLALYADAEFMLAEDGQSWEPMPAVSDPFALVAWVPSNATHAEPVAIDLSIGRRVIDLSLAVREMRKEAPKAARLDLDEWVPRPGGDTLKDKVMAAGSQDELAELYERHADEWTDELTALGFKAIASN